jgi:uncharacterized 2Fe-2S/4Fe-4S cluster protein (DUF4445 family)
MNFEIDIEPVGRRIPCSQGDTLLSAAQRAGIVLNATCGGEGVCGRCLVRVMAGQVSPLTFTEEAELGKRVEEGWRLACQTEVCGNVRIHIPPESLATAQRIQTEGHSLPVEINPAVRVVTVNLPPPSLSDPLSDTERIKIALGMPDLVFSLPVLRELANALRINAFAVSVFLNGCSVVGLRPANTAALGLAIDLGTTKLAGYLVDLSTGETLACAGAMNPQIAFGEDVMARISHAISKSDGSEQLRSVIVEALQKLANGLCEQTKRSLLDIADVVIVGNTVMHHLFLGLPVKQLGLSPYIPTVSSALDVPAFEIGFDFAPGAHVLSLPNIAGFIGADHVAMLLGSGMVKSKGVVLGLDIGTNTEFSLIANGRHFSCSTASGPAFEGAHIKYGMRAAPGAIEKVLIYDGKLMLQTIDNQPPIGLCGSGILDLIAQMRKAGYLNSHGALDGSKGTPFIRQGKNGLEFVLVPSLEKEGREIIFDRSDVNEIQLAKSAMRTGVQILLQKAGIDEKDIDSVVIAGAFGSYLDVQSGIDIGMFPKLERERFIQVGNAAGTGARMALLSLGVREQAREMSRRITYIELTSEPSFSSMFARNLLIE